MSGLFFADNVTLALGGLAKCVLTLMPVVQLQH